jgi:hypothetical protein
MSLQFSNVGHDSIGVLRFDPDGMRGPVPGAVGSGGAKHMSFMPGDGKRGMPRFVDVTWMVATAEYNAEWEVLSSRQDKYSKQWNADVDAVNARAPHYTRRIDLTPIITPELIAQVRADRQNTQLKVIITFNNDEVDIRAEAYKWRNR